VERLPVAALTTTGGDAIIRPLAGASFPSSISVRLSAAGPPATGSYIISRRLVLVRYELPD